MENLTGTKKCDFVLLGLKTKLRIFIGTKNLINPIKYIKLTLNMTLKESRSQTETNIINQTVEYDLNRV